MVGSQQGETSEDQRGVNITRGPRGDAMGERPRVKETFCVGGCNKVVSVERIRLDDDDFMAEIGRGGVPIGRCLCGGGDLYVRWEDTNEE